MSPALSPGMYIEWKELPSIQLYNHTASVLRDHKLYEDFLTSHKILCLLPW